MQSTPSLPQEVIDAFHLMWGNFPERVSLVHKSRQVMAINKVMEKQGLVKPGMNCAKIGSPEAHKGCRANQALAGGEAAFVHMPLPDRDAVAFWIPLDGHPEFFVHFSVGLTINYKTGQRMEYTMPSTAKPDSGE